MMKMEYPGLFLLVAIVGGALGTLAGEWIKYAFKQWKKNRKAKLKAKRVPKIYLGD